MKQTHELVFGFGASRCIGMGIALIEINKVVFEVMRKFDVAVVNPARPWRSTSYGIFFQQDFFVTLSLLEEGAPPACKESAGKGFEVAQAIEVPESVMLAA